MDKVHELEVFSAFASAANFELADGSTESTNPPEPDVLCTISGERQYFEIGEIMWAPPDNPGATLAKGHHLSDRESRRKAGLLAEGKHEEADRIQTWGGLGWPLLASIKQALEKKCARTYQAYGRRVSLLLYYERQPPHEPFYLLFDRKEYIKDLLNASQFDRIWMYYHCVAYMLTLGDPNYRTLFAGNRVALSALATPESSRAVIGSLRLRNGELAMSFNAHFGAILDAAPHALDAAVTAWPPDPRRPSRVQVALKRLRQQFRI
jgi:hypothetical protein